MGQATDEAGNIWETDEAGNPVRLVQPAGTGRVFSLPPNPKDLRKEAITERREDRADQREERAATATEVANRLKEQEIILARQKEEREGNTAKQISDWRANLNNIGLLEGRVAKLRELYDQHFAGKGLQSVGESYAPKGLAPQYGVFDDTSMQMLADMAKAKGLTSQQFNTPAEQKMFFEPLIPKRGDTDEQILNKLDYLEKMIETGRKTTETQLGIAHQKADNEVPDPTTGADLKPPPNDPPGLVGAEGDTRDEYSARLSAQVDAMINAGASKAMIDTVLKNQGFPSIRTQDLAAAKRWMKENPGKQYFGAMITKAVPLNLGQKISGSALGSGLARYTNAATAGTVGALAGEKGQGALNAMAAMHPNASLVGDLAGGVTGVLGMEAGLAARAPAALARFAPRGADLLYGATSGFNQAEEGEGLQGAALGGAAGLAGGFLGDRAMRGIGAAARGVRDPAVQLLREAGIPMTAGQVVGGGVKKIEDALTSLPFVGNMIDARRMEGLRGFNESAFQAAAPPGAVVDQTGAAGMRQLRGAVGDAYDAALTPVTVDVTTPEFLADRANVENYINTAIRPVDGAQEAAREALIGRIDIPTQATAGMMTGRGFQESYRGLARTGRERANRDYGHEVGQAMRQAQDALAGQLERQHPGAFDDFIDANAANRRTNVLADALKNAANQGEELVTPAQLNRADVTSTSRLSGKLESASGNRPFYDLATAGQEVLPSKLPDSGTWTRALVGGGATGMLGGTGALLGGGEGAAKGTGAGLGMTLLLAAGGSRPAQRALTTILTERPDLAVQLGESFLRNSRIGGGVGAGVLTPLTVGN